MAEDLAPVEVDGQVGEVGAAVLEAAKGTPVGLEEGLEDGVARLHVDLAPLPALGVPELERDDARARHGQVAGVEHVAGFAVHVGLAVAEAEDFEEREVAREGHGDALGAAFFVGRGRGTEDGAVGFGRLVVGCYRLVGHGAGGRVLVVEVELPGGCLLEQLACAVA